MIAFLDGFLSFLKPLVVIGILLGFGAVFFAGGGLGLWAVLKLVAFGIVMNFVIWLAARRLWPNIFGAGHATGKEKP